MEVKRIAVVVLLTLWAVLTCAAGCLLCTALLVRGDADERDLALAGALFVAATGCLLASHRARPDATALRRQEAFLADMAHDLRTPLTALRALAEAVLSHPDQQAQLLPRTVELARRMDTIVDDVLMRARLTGGAETLAVEPVWLDQLVATLVEETPCGGAEVTVITAPTVVTADPVLIRRAVGNLLDNALRHGRDGGSPAVVRVTVADGRVIVADRGPGIDPSLADRMFDRFTSLGGSSGLGLSIVRWVVDAHGGKLRVSGNRGGGTVFEISLSTAGRPLPRAFGTVATIRPAVTMSTAGRTRGGDSSARAGGDRRRG
jgi:two-component system, OmpR family, sensor kinase